MVEKHRTEVNIFTIKKFESSVKLRFLLPFMLSIFILTIFIPCRSNLQSWTKLLRLNVIIHITLPLFFFFSFRCFLLYILMEQQSKWIEHLFQAMWNELFGQLSEVPGLKISNLSATVCIICEVILYGSSELNVLANRLLMEATFQFIKILRDSFN